MSLRSGKGVGRWIASRGAVQLDCGRPPEKIVIGDQRWGLPAGRIWGSIWNEPGDIVGWKKRRQLICHKHGNKVLCTGPVAAMVGGLELCV